MTKKYFYYTLLLSLIFSFSATSVLAQGTKDKHGKWMKEVRDYKRDFMTKELELSKSQQQDFFPLYTEMEKEVFQINKEARDMEKKITASKTNISDLEYEKVAEALSEVKSKEAQIEAEYFQKYSKILSKEQLFKLKRAENRFKRTMLNHHRGGENQNRAQ
ncbi:MAG: hypothetical protein RR061_00935 [Muribaculaceae bacterium]